MTSTAFDFVKVSPIGNLSKLPRLQISDESSPSKPDNYRISPATAMPDWGAESSNFPQSRFKETPNITGHDLKLAEPQEHVHTQKNKSLPWGRERELSTSESPTLDVATSTLSIEESLAEVLADWSGRGTHVNFQSDEEVPLTEGRFLGHGSMGSVFETTVRGHLFAWKKRYCRRKIGDAEMKEIEILKKVSHYHIIKFAGSYTHRQFLGLLLYPVATCDLATLFEDAEALFDDGTWDPVREKRFEALGLQSDNSVWIDSCPPIITNTRAFLSSRMGCIISAVEYLHNQKIRHKDLKPSNILVGARNLWLTDFGTATDFSNQTVSTTDNCERGTPKYFAPEMAAFEKCGRSADIFSLGCVLLEMYTLQQRQTLEVLRELRSKHDKSYHSNLEGIHEWLSRSTGDQINTHIQLMLARDPTKRPRISEIRTNFALIDLALKRSMKASLFNKCCTDFISRNEHERELDIARHTIADQVRATMQKDIDRLKKENDDLLAHTAELQGKVDQQVQSLNALVQ